MATAIETGLGERDEMTNEKEEKKMKKKCRRPEMPQEGRLANETAIAPIAMLKMVVLELVLTLVVMMLMLMLMLVVLMSIMEEAQRKEELLV
jgi:hypothetical protein